MRLLTQPVGFEVVSLGSAEVAFRDWLLADGPLAEAMGRV